MTTLHEMANGELVAANGVETHTFSAGEPHLNFGPGARVAGRDFVLTARGGSFAELGEALVYADGLRRRDAATVTLFVPYLPGARQDRGEPFTAQVVATAINAGGFDRVVAVDPHSPVMPALIERFEALDATALVPHALFPADGRTACIVAPDAGASERARAVAVAHGLPLVQAHKRRDPAHHFRVADYTCDPITADVAIVIDDICDGGATFLALADATGLPAERLRLWTSHGIYSRGAAPIKARYGVLATTDSLTTADAADIVVPLADPLARHLAGTRATQKGASR